MKELRTAAEVLERLSHNQDALRAAVEELAKWVGDRGAANVVDNVNGGTCHPRRQYRCRADRHSGTSSGERQAISGRMQMGRRLSGIMLGNNYVPAIIF